MADVSKLEETGKPIDEQCIRVGAECSRPKCKDCVHYDVCYELTYHEPNGEIVGREVCNNFKDKSRFVDLPCKVGDTVYFVYRNEIFEHKIRKIEIGEYGGFVCSSHCFPFSSFGQYVFLTREEAEKALKGRKK